MNLNFDPSKNLSNRAAQDASFHDQERKEKNRLEIPNEEERDTEDFSYEAQRRKQILRTVTGILGIVFILFVIYRFSKGLF